MCIFFLCSCYSLSPFFVPPLYIYIYTFYIISLSISLYDRYRSSEKTHAKPPAAPSEPLQLNGNDSWEALDEPPSAAFGGSDGLVTAKAEPEVTAAARPVPSGRSALFANGEVFDASAELVAAAASSAFGTTGPAYRGRGAGLGGRVSTTDEASPRGGDGWEGAATEEVTVMENLEQQQPLAMEDVNESDVIVASQLDSLCLDDGPRSTLLQHLHPAADVGANREEAKGEYDASVLPSMMEESAGYQQQPAKAQAWMDSPGAAISSSREDGAEAAVAVTCGIGIVEDYMPSASTGIGSVIGGSSGRESKSTDVADAVEDDEAEGYADTIDDRGVSPVVGSGSGSGSGGFAMVPAPATTVARLVESPDLPLGQDGEAVIDDLDEIIGGGGGAVSAGAPTGLRRVSAAGGGRGDARSRS